ncbi:MAG: hypothetical protein IKY26_04960 [Erysipelotrichaceae bacterium]|nr:hypothetical protein [Erysipelotrichaceae bacterium]
MKKEKLERHERMYGPHFNEECANKAVQKMENEDGSKGPRWSIEEAERVAQQYGVNLKGEKFNKYDWFVALNMIRSDFYRAVINMTGSDNVKHFVELTKAWLNDKDIEEGKMWFYFKFVMCEEGREESEEWDEEDSHYNHARGRRSGRMSMNTYHKRHHDYYDDYDNDYEYELEGTYNMRGGNYAMDNDYNYARGRRMSRY